MVQRSPENMVEGMPVGLLQMEKNTLQNLMKFSTDLQLFRNKMCCQGITYILVVQWGALVQSAPVSPSQLAYPSALIGPIAFAHY